VDSRVNPQPGPVGEEATRLIEAMSQWLGAHWSRGGPADVPIATDSDECRVCPFCQVLALMRHTRPETFAHLADASSSLVAALRTVVEAHAGHGAGTASGRGGVERIDLDEDAGVAR
jgi:hypothetical protein